MLQLPRFSFSLEVPFRASPRYQFTFFKKLEIRVEPLEISKEQPYVLAVIFMLFYLFSRTTASYLLMMNGCEEDSRPGQRRDFFLHLRFSYVRSELTARTERISG